MAGTFQCSIVTPDKAAFDGEVTYATFQAWDGQLGVQNLRSPLLTKLGIGSLRLDLPDGMSRRFLLCGGFAQMQDNVLTLITDEATEADEISLADAEAELEEANARAVTGTDDRDKAELEQRKAFAKVALARAASA